MIRLVLPGKYLVIPFLCLTAMRHTQPVQWCGAIRRHGKEANRIASYGVMSCTPLFARGLACCQIAQARPISRYSKHSLFTRNLQAGQERCLVVSAKIGCQFIPKTGEMSLDSSSPSMPHHSDAHEPRFNRMFTQINQAHISFCQAPWHDN